MDFEKGKEKYYLLHWNDEYCNMAILAGPMDYAAASCELKKQVVDRLSGLGIAENMDRAEEMYNAALRDQNITDLWVKDASAGILYGDEFVDVIEIVAYNQDMSAREAEETAGKMKAFNCVKITDLPYENPEVVVQSFATYAAACAAIAEDYEKSRKEIEKEDFTVYTEGDYASYIEGSDASLNYGTSDGTAVILWYIEETCISDGKVTEDPDCTDGV